MRPCTAIRLLLILVLEPQFTMNNLFHVSFPHVSPALVNCAIRFQPFFPRAATYFSSPVARIHIVEAYVQIHTSNLERQYSGSGYHRIRRIMGGYDTTTKKSRVQCHLDTKSSEPT